MKKLFFALSFLLVLIISGGFLCAGSGQTNFSDTLAQSYLDQNIHYTKIQKELNVLQNKVIDVTVTVGVEYMHDGINVGLIYNVPKINKITRIVDGKKYVNTTKARIFDVQPVTMDGKEEFWFLQEDSEYVYFNTGADGDYKSGRHEYVFKYKYDMGEDFIDQFDDLTYDVLDSDVGSAVDHFEATITFPSKFLSDGQGIEDVVSFRTNEMEALLLEDVNFAYDEQSFTITCEKDDISAGQGIAIQVILPQKYFKTVYQANAIYYVSFVMLILAFVAVPLLIFISKKLNRRIITNEFYPPKGFSPLDVARVYRGQLKNEDLASLVIWWASKGLVTLQQSNGSFLIKKNHEYNLDESADGFLKQKGEKEYFDALFEKGDVFVPNVTNISPSIEKSLRQIYKAPAPLDRRQTLIKALIVLFSFLPLLLFGVWQVMFTGQLLPLFALIFPFIAALVFANIKSMPKLFTAVWCIIFGLVPLLFVMLSFALPVYDIFALRFLTSAAFVLLCPLVVLVQSFTKNQLEFRGRVLGFRRFLQRVELKQLERLVQQDPEYYYNVLPFCYCLGLTKVMKDKFAALGVKLPEYCCQYDPVVFGSMMAGCLHYTGSQSVMSSGRGFGGFGGGFGGSSTGGGGGGGFHGR